MNGQPTGLRRLAVYLGLVADTPRDATTDPHRGPARPCETCGALVPVTHARRHADWHARVRG